MSIHISGSLAFDRMMTFTGLFSDHLIPEKIHTLSVMFTIDRVEEKRGGTAGNIAYSLCLLNEKPYIYSAVGKDFQGEYKQALKRIGANIDNVRTVEESLTSCAYITSDSAGNQITGFHPAAMNFPTGPSKEPATTESDWAVVAPGNVEDMKLFPKLYKEKNTSYIFDPGQQITILDPQTMRDGIHKASIVIGNDYEISLIGQKTGLSKEDILSQAQYLITTLGDAGACISQKGKEDILITAVPVENVAEPTGAGDSFRSGLLKALHSGSSIEDAVKLGSCCASFCVEKFGTQEHFFTHEIIKARYEKNYGPYKW